ncbi:MAG TPA: hypothetical protein VG168_06610, partial [Bryobacteraceae bacterium]|nr:hypothetical protein [Bryobacteraceae bacterium]
LREDIGIKKDFRGHEGRRGSMSFYQAALVIDRSIPATAHAHGSFGPVVVAVTSPVPRPATVRLAVAPFGPVTALELPPG